MVFIADTTFTKARFTKSKVIFSWQSNQNEQSQAYRWFRDFLGWQGIREQTCKIFSNVEFYVEFFSFNNVVLVPVVTIQQSECTSNSYTPTSGMFL
jgi:hypothetical protein